MAIEVELLTEKGYRCEIGDCASNARISMQTHTAWEWLLCRQHARILHRELGKVLVKLEKEEQGQ